MEQQADPKVSFNYRESRFVMRALDEVAAKRGFLKADGTANRAGFIRYCIHKEAPEVQVKARQYAKEAQDGTKATD